MNTKEKEFIKQLKEKLINKYSTEPNLRIDIRDWDLIDKLAEGNSK